MASSSSTYSNPPCAACKFLRRKCLPGCTFAPYFPPEVPSKFISVHKIFGASNVSKLLSEIRPHQREDAVNSLAYEAEARLKDPVYGCVGTISVLQKQVLLLQKELEATNADLMHYARYDQQMLRDGYPVANSMSYNDHERGSGHREREHFTKRVDYARGSNFDPNFSNPYSNPWNYGRQGEN